MAWTGGLRESERRSLRVFAFDPMVDRFRPPILLRVPYEHVEPGPVGRLVAVTDVDPVKGRSLPPLDLDDPAVLLGSGLTPSETDYRSHQQSVYAVAMAALEAFERGLGRPIIWHAGRPLRLVPHAGTMANAFFDFDTFAVLFGAFKAIDANPGANIAGQTVYSCLAWDVVAHQTSHPVLADLRPFEMGAKVPEPRWPDSYALHEGFCDLVALMVRLTDPSVVSPMLRDHGLEIEGTNLLMLASQFGQAAGLGPAIRAFPTPGVPPTSFEAHDLGASFTSAVIEAFLATLRRQCRDLFGLHGPPRSDGWRHPDLVGRLTTHTTRLAADVLQTCIGALDLLPPLDARFGDVLRAIVTVSVDRFGPRQDVFRAQLIEAFRIRGMTPQGVESLSPDALRLEPFSPSLKEPLPHVDDALLLTQHALELRRAYMTDPEHIPEARKIVRTDMRRLKRWHTSIGSFAKEHARRLGLEESRPMHVANLTGAFVRDPSGSVRARVTVQIAQPPAHKDGPRVGATIVANSTGELQYLIRTRERRVRRAVWPYRTPTTDLDLVAKLGSVLQ